MKEREEGEEKVKKEHSQTLIHDLSCSLNSIHGITMIAILRMGLLDNLKEAAFHQFMKLPLYEDMAPWNIVFRGPNLDYIDYDTQSKTFGGGIAEIYQLLEVLANYKRTVKDLSRCGQNAGNAWGFQYLSDCVGSNPHDNGDGTLRNRKPDKCPDSAFPVRCPDGTCHANYISCMQSMSEDELEREKPESRR